MRLARPVLPVDPEVPVPEVLEPVAEVLVPEAPVFPEVEFELDVLPEEFPEFPEFPDALPVEFPDALPDVEVAAGFALQPRAHSTRSEASLKALPGSRRG